MKHRIPEKFIPLLTLPVMLAVCVAIWLLTDSSQYARMEAQNGAWDLRAFPFADESALLVGAVEYIPDALLTPEAFEARAGEIRIGSPENVSEYATSRQRILLPEGQSYRLVIRSVDYSERLYINGKWMADVGTPGDSAQTTAPDTALLSFTVEPVNGEIVILRQSANFVHREGGWHDGIYIGLPQLLRGAPDGDITILMIGCFLALFLVHLALYFIFRSYPANLYFSLFCLVWLLRTSVTGTKALSDLVPALSWYVKFRIEYLSLPLTAFLMMRMLHALFPGILPSWLRRAVYALSALFAAFFLLAPSYASSWAIMGCYGWMAAAIGVIIVCFLLRLRRPSLAQIVSLAGTALFFYSGMRDMFYYSGVVLPPMGDADLSRAAMLFFVFCQMTAMFMGTVHAAEQAHAAEQRLTAENAALDRLSRMKSELMATISHETRTPLAVLSGYAELVSSELRAQGVDEQTARDLDNIADEAQRVATLLDEMQNISRQRDKEAGRTRLELAGAVEGVARLYTPILARRNTALKTDMAADLPAVYASAGEITQVLFNLLQNARDHTEGGTVTLSARAGGGFVAVTVADTGEGVPPELLADIFTRGVSGGMGGTGIGLSVCREIIEGHGGTIQMENRPEGGAAVRFTLPVYREDTRHGDSSAD